VSSACPAHCPCQTPDTSPAADHGYAGQTIHIDGASVARCKCRARFAGHTAADAMGRLVVHMARARWARVQAAADTGAGCLGAVVALALSTAFWLVMLGFWWAGEAIRA